MDDLQKNNTGGEAKARCAIYARFSSDQQREASIEDQIRKCREFAEKKGWVIEQAYVRADRATSGTSLEGRDQLNFLVAAAKQRPRPFDVLLIDDTSRLSRNLPQFLSIVKGLGFHDIGVCSVSQGLDSRDESSYLPSTILGLMDEQFIKDLAKKVHRGQVGRVLKGQIAGGRCYGYKNVPIEDPTRKGDYGRPFVVGVRRDVVPEEAEVIHRIFEMYAAGSSFDKIARTLRAEGVPPPYPPRRDSVHAWAPDSIGQILRNEKYIGIHIWNKTKSVRDETGHIATRHRRREEWVEFEIPEWRTVSDELWKKVQEQLRLKKRIGVPKIGGLSRTERSQKYIFSGLLCCGTCNGPMNIVDGTAGGATVWYGCPAHRYKGACTNAVTIRRDRLEEQLLSWLTRDLLEGDRLEEAASSLHAEVRTRILQLQAEARKNAINAPELRKELAQKKQEAYNIIDVFARMGRNSSPLLQSCLREAEDRIREIEELLSRATEPDSVASFSAEDIRDHLLSKLGDFQAVLTSEPLIAKQILRRHIRKITLTPRLEGKKRGLTVNVEFGLGGGGDSGVMLTGTLESYLQQYGFTTMTLDGLELNTRAPRRIKSKSSKTCIGEESHSATSADPNSLLASREMEPEILEDLPEVAHNLLAEESATRIVVATLPDGD